MSVYAFLIDTVIYSLWAVAGVVVVLVLVLVGLYKTRN